LSELKIRESPAMKKAAHDERTCQRSTAKLKSNSGLASNTVLLQNAQRRERVVCQGGKEGRRGREIRTQKGHEEIHEGTTPLTRVKAKNA